MCLLLMVHRTRCETRSPCVIDADGTTIRNPYFPSVCRHNMGRMSDHLLATRTLANPRCTAPERAEADLTIKRVLGRENDEDGGSGQFTTGRPPRRACPWHSADCCEISAFRLCYFKPAPGTGTECGTGILFHKTIASPDQDWLGNGPEVFTADGVIPRRLADSSNGYLGMVPMDPHDGCILKSAHEMPSPARADARAEQGRSSPQQHMHMALLVLVSAGEAAYRLAVAVRAVVERQKDDPAGPSLDLGSLRARSTDVLGAWEGAREYYEQLCRAGYVPALPALSEQDRVGTAAGSTTGLAAHMQLCEPTVRTVPTITNLRLMMRGFVGAEAYISLVRPDRGAAESAGLQPQAPCPALARFAARRDLFRQAVRFEATRIDGAAMAAALPGDWQPLAQAHIGARRELLRLASGIDMSGETASQDVFMVQEVWHGAVAAGSGWVEDIDGLLKKPVLMMCRPAGAAAEPMPAQARQIVVSQMVQQALWEEDNVANVGSSDDQHQQELVPQNPASAGPAPTQNTAATIDPAIVALSNAAAVPQDPAQQDPAQQWPPQDPQTAAAENGLWQQQPGDQGQAYLDPAEHTPQFEFPTQEGNVTKEQEIARLTNLFF